MKQKQKAGGQDPVFRTPRIVLNSEPFSPSGPPAAQDAPAALGGHAHKKAVGSLPLRVAECGQVLFHLSIPGAI
jgi:hypothetical protein